MKRFFLLLFVSVMAINLSAAKLVLISYQNQQELKTLMTDENIRVNYFSQSFVVATVENSPKQSFVLLKNGAWEGDMVYFVMYLPKNQLASVTPNLPLESNILYQSPEFLIVEIENQLSGELIPLKNDGMVRLFNNKATWPRELNLSHNRDFDPDPFVVGLLEEVSAENITNDVQHLQDYGTRNAYASQSVEAQNWIKQKYEDLGLEVVLQDFTMPSGSASDNVIATLTGTKYPNEFVVCGAHYDSYSGGGTAPGADDNASGTAGVLEIARIMSQYTFDRSIIFCSFSGEEYGLYGSSAYASMAEQQNMDILGYFNLDMTGYLQVGGVIHTDLIYPSSAQELATFYTEVASVYLPDFIVEVGTLTGGDSDHTSFNNHGFMGIFPFEDSDNYSPYIHTSNDIVGLSYNNEDQARVFTQASLAAIATMANRLNPPRNLVAFPGDMEVNLEWAPLPDAEYFKIYRDGELIDTASENSFVDLTVENGTQYTYYITAIYADSGDESAASNTATATPMPPIALPLLIDFENGAPYWDYEGTWGLTTADFYSSTHSLTESPVGNYQNNIESTSTLRALDLSEGYTEASVSFWTKYRLEQNYDYMYFEVTTNGNNWTILETFNGNQTSWSQKTYSLDSYLGEPYVQLRFRFKSDSYITDEGMFIDDFEITSTFVGLDEKRTEVVVYPNPARDYLSVKLSVAGEAQLMLIDQQGRTVKNMQISGFTKIDLKDLSAGSYVMRIHTSDRIFTQILEIY